MRRCICIALLVLLCVLPSARAETALDTDMIEHLLNLAPMATFTGAPDPQAGWIAVADLLNENPKADGKRYSMEALQKLCRGLFSEGRLTGKPKDTQFGGYFKKQGKGYQFIQEDYPGVFHIAINEIVPQRDGTFVVDYTCYDSNSPDDPDSGDWFWGNARAKLALDEDALFGATVLAVRVTRGAYSEFSPASASSDAGEKPGAAVDGEDSTCWSYDPERTPDAELTIRFDPDTQVRGLIVLLGDASSEQNYAANRRIKRLSATLSDGSVREAEALDSWEGLYGWNQIIVAFRDIQTGGEVRLSIPETYAGNGANRVCVSEVLAF